MLFHAGTDARHFILPPLARGIGWRLFLDTAAESPADIYPALDGPPPPFNDIITVPARSLMVFVRARRGSFAGKRCRHGRELTALAVNAEGSARRPAGVLQRRVSHRMFH